MGITGRVFQTQRHSALPPSAQSAIREKVELFDDFTEDNDPHGEHDFGAFELRGAQIGYYAPDMEHGSENPADPQQRVRVLRSCWPASIDRRAAPPSNRRGFPSVTGQEGVGHFAEVSENFLL